MSDLETIDPLDAIVGHALRVDAGRAPQLPDEWPGIDGVPVGVRRSDRPRWLSVISGTVAAAILIGVVLVAVARDEDGGAAGLGTWLPDGTEYVLMDLGPATAVPSGGPVVSALTRQVAVEGHPLLTVYTSLMYMITDTATVWRCFEGGCRPEWDESTWSSGITSSVDNHVADFDLWFVEGLPTDTAFVTYAVGEVRLWQRPVAGVAAFPASPVGSDPEVAAYDSNGDELGRFAGRDVPSPHTGTRPLAADISVSQAAEFSDLTHDSMASCLSDNGASIGTGDVATFDDGVDQASIWAECVITVKQTVAEAVKALDPRFIDPLTEQPTSEDPAIGASPPPVMQTYVIQPGDLPVTVADQFDIPVDDLLAANGLTLNDDESVPEEVRGRFVTNWPGVGATLIIPTK